MNTIFQTPKRTNSLHDVVVMHATFYYRWSTPSQVKERHFRNNRVVYDEKAVIEAEVELLKRNIEEYRGFCPSCHREIKTLFTGHGFLDKGQSGRKTDRAYINNLIEVAEGESTFQVVFTPFSSRIGRRRSVSATLRDRLKDVGVQIYSIHQPTPIKCPECYDPLDDDSAVISETMSDMQAELELSQIRRNYKTGMPIRIKDGKPVGSLPYGLIKKYRTLGQDSSGNDMLEEYYVWVDEKVEVLNRIAQYYLDGLGTWKICQILNLENIPSPHGKQWGRSAILTLLKNPAYSGVVRFGWKPVRKGKRVIQPKEKWQIEKAKYRGIWTQEFYQRIQDEISRRAGLGGRAVSSSALLIGLLKCGFCGYSMFQVKGGKPLKDGTPYEWKGYGCGAFLHGRSCQHNGKAQVIVDHYVLTEVLKLVNDNTRTTFYEKLRKSKVRKSEQLLKEKKAKLKMITRSLDRAGIAYREGVDSLIEYTKLKNDLKPQIESLTSEVAKLELVCSTESSFSWEKRYEEAITRFMKRPNADDQRIVRSILSRLIERIEIRNKPIYIKIFYKLEN